MRIRLGALALLMVVPSCIVQSEPLSGLTGDPGPPGDAGPPGEAGPPAVIDTATIQARVIGSCPPGQAIRAINEDGSVTCEATGVQSLMDTVAMLQTRLDELEKMDCPRLMLPDGQVRVYKRNLAIGTWIECGYTLAPGYVDSLVRVGDFWIDQFEGFIADSLPAECSGAIGDATGLSTQATPCSVKGQVPTTSISQLQAITACANVGKHLCTNIEWQSAVSGTPDPGAWPDTAPGDGCTGSSSDSKCTTCASAHGTAGQAVECVSRFGAYDMIGNTNEWVENWLPVNNTFSTPADQFGNWPQSFGNDYTGTFPSYACTVPACQQPIKGMLGGIYRGGNEQSGPGAGAFCISSDRFPGSVSTGIGFRCCAGRQ